MKQKDLITYGLIGLAVYFLFMKKEDTETEDTGGAGSGGTNDDTPELATNGNKTFTDGSNTEDNGNDREEFPNTSN